MDPEAYVRSIERSSHGFVEDEQSLEDLVAVLDAMGVMDWARIGNRAYPPQYALSLGSHQPNPVAVSRLRDKLGRIPRVDPMMYDILFNAEGGDFMRDGPTWDVVKWMQVPELQGWLPGMGWITSTFMFEPYPVYSIPAVERSPMSLGDLDYQVLLKNSTVMRGGGGQITRDIRERNAKKQEARKATRADQDRDFADYYRGLFKKAAEEQGL